MNDLPSDERVRTRSSATTRELPSFCTTRRSRERRDLLDGVLSAAALSIEMARLRVEVRLQLAEVEASRTRIVEAGYEERRRLERDLHDGAQQRLVSLGVQLRRLQLIAPARAQRCSPRRSTRPSARSGRRSATSARSLPACVRPGSTTASRLRCATSRGRRPFRSRSRLRASGSPRASRRLPTSSPARPSRTPSSTVRRRRSRCGPSARTGRCT